MCGLQVPTRSLAENKNTPISKTIAPTMSGQFPYRHKEDIEMGKILDSISLFEELRKFEYNIAIENGVTFSFRFKREHYHHLAGFQYLTDLPDIAKPRLAHKFYSDLMHGKIKESRIESSTKYPHIAERVEAFAMLEEILETGEGRIIVEFNPDIAGSVIEAKFLLFKRKGTPFQGNATYYSLFLDNNGKDEIFFPVSFLVEHSGLYVREQETFFCTITRQPLNTKKDLVGV